MNKWLIAIALAVAAAVVLAYTWQSIPYVNAWLISSGVASKIDGLKSSITDVVTGKMPVATVIPLLGTAATLSLGAIKGALNYVKREKANTQLQLNDAQSTINQAKSLFTGEKAALEHELAEVTAKKDDVTNQLAELTKLFSTKTEGYDALQREYARLKEEYAAIQASI